MSLRVNPAVARLRCSKSGVEVPTNGFTRPIGLCPCCSRPGKPVVVEYDREAVIGDLRATPMGSRSTPGIWRWSAFLPVLGVPADYAADVGATPIVRHNRLSAELGVEVLLKNEGTNPSGSFKDRGLAVAVAFGAACGAKRFALPTQGNAGVAACLFSARLGLPGCLVWMPEGYQGCVYHRACEFFGGEVRFFGPNIATAGRNMRETVAEELASGEIVDLSTFFEPGRLEGKKTMGLEIVEHFGAALPDAIVYPTGGGTGLVGIWKAFEELDRLGVLDRGDRALPRMVAVQSANCAPVVQAFHRDLADVEPVTSLGTVADGLDVPGAIMGHAMLRVLRASSGAAVAVSEEEIVTAFARYGRLGINAGLESAATLAGLEALLRDGIVRRGDRVLLINTGTQLIPLSKKEA